MSASTERKNRKAAREAGTDKKTLALQEEAKKKAKSKLRWTWGSIGVALLIVLVLFLNSGFFFTHTTAVTIGEHSYTPAEVSYRYASEYHNFANQYGSYAAMFGLDTSGGLAGLDNQPCPMLEEGTWKDYFMQSAEQQLANNAALLDYAKENGITLDEDEIAEVDAGFEGLDSMVKLQGYGSVDKFFAANYGSGVTANVARQAALDDALASKTYQQVSDEQEYTPEELEEYYQSLNGESDVFEYAYYHVAAETVESADAEGNVSQNPTDETLAAAELTANAILAAYDRAVTGEPAAAEEPEDADIAEDVDDAEDAEDTEDAEDADTAPVNDRFFAPVTADDFVALLDAAISEQVADGISNLRDNVEGASLGDYKDWLMDSRALGDATVIESSSGTGYDVVVFLSRNDNHYKTANVRHILVKAVADADGNYTDEAKADALAKAQEILDEWKNGEMTEDSFAALAEQYSEDGGSNTNGGLYENIAHGQMVSEFDAFCYAGHNSGDTDIVYGDNGSYAGYHVMYYVGEGEQYSDYIARTRMLSEDMTEWMTAVTEGYEAVPGFGLRFVGK